jgi:Neuraminidase (sialidase)
VLNGGASNIGWATSTNAGVAWTHGFLPGTTANTGGPWTKVTDPVVAYSRRHATWQISFMGITGTTGTHVLTSRSTDGGLTWSAPVVIAQGVGEADKNWTVCDNHAGSPHRGTCYTSFSNKQAVRSFRSTDGGATWAASVLVSNLVVGQQHHDSPAPFRDWPLPSLDVDTTGRVYAAWSDCRFRAGCATNDLVISESADGQAWPAPYRVPLQQLNGARDHYLPGLAVAPGTGGGNARLGITYYYLDNAACEASCRINAAFASSVNGGATWSSPTHIAAMALDRFPNSQQQGRMVSDYISTSIVGTTAHPVLPVARTPGQGAAFDVAMYHPTGGLPVTGGPIPPG